MHRNGVRVNPGYMCPGDDDAARKSNLADESRESAYQQNEAVRDRKSLKASNDESVSQKTLLGRYPGRARMRYFLPTSLTTSTLILRNPSLGLVAG